MEYIVIFLNFYLFNISWNDLKNSTAQLSIKIPTPLTLIDLRAHSHQINQMNSWETRLKG